MPTPTLPPSVVEELKRAFSENRVGGEMQKKEGAALPEDSSNANDTACGDKKPQALTTSSKGQEMDATMMTDAACSMAGEKAGELASKVADDPTIGEHLNFTYTNMGYILTPRGNSSEETGTAM